MGFNSNNRKLISSLSIGALFVFQVLFFQNCSFQTQHGTEGSQSSSEQGDSETDSALANLCTGHVSHTDKVVIPKMEIPGFLVPYSDPAFGSNVTRITNAKSGGVIKTMYNTVQAWNSDESKLILYHTGTEGAGHHLYDGMTYKYLEKLEINPSDLEEVFWDTANPKLFYYIESSRDDEELYGALVSYDVTTKIKSMVVDLANECGYDDDSDRTALAGSDVQNIQGSFIGIRCNFRGGRGNSERTFYVNVSTGEISGSINLNSREINEGFVSGLSPIRTLSPGPSGKYFYLQGTVVDENLKVVHNLDINFLTFTVENGQEIRIPNPEHITIGSLPNGHDGMYAAMYDGGELGCDGDTNGGTGSVVSYDFETGKCRVIIGESTGWGYPLSGTHLSAISTQRPGWVTFSTIGYNQFNHFDDGNPAPVLTSEIALTFPDEKTPSTCRLAHTRTFGKSAQNTSGYGEGYFGEPHPIMSPSGNRILFSSDWYDSGSVNVYVIDLGK